MRSTKFELKGEQLKKLSNYLVFVLVGLALIYWAATMDVNKEQSVTEQTPTTNVSSDIVLDDSSMQLDSTEKALEKKVQQVLSMVKDVGQVEVRIRLANSGSKTLAFNDQTSNRETVENDKQGGTRSTTEITKSDEIVMVRNKNGVETPVILQTSRPEVKGVLVVAEGAEDQGIQLKLSRTVQTLLDVPAHKVSVVSMKGGN